MGLCRLGNAYPQIGNYFGLGGETDDTKVSGMSTTAYQPLGYGVGLNKAC
jgi:hypothetical protein